MKKVVVISGGSDGLGKEIARILAPDYQVIILSPTDEKLKAAAAELNVDYQVCDVSDWNMVDTAVKNILARHHQIDVLINNAGIWIEGELEDCNPSKIRRVIEVNTLGTIYLTRAIIPTMKSQKSGRIINIISQAGLYAKPERSAYSASKWAVTGFTKCIETDLAKFGISVTGLYPAYMSTNILDKAGVSRPMPSPLDPSEVAKTVKYIISLPSNVELPELGIKNIE